MEKRISQFIQWVNTRTENFYQQIIQQENPMDYFQLNTYDYFGTLVTEGGKVLDEFHQLLTQPERFQLARRLQSICEGSLDEIAKRLSTK